MDHINLYSMLELCLRDILAEIKPAEGDRVSRQNALDQFANCLRNMQSCRGCVVKSFGSFASNLYSKWSDVDVSVQLDGVSENSTTRIQKRSLLRQIMRALQRSGVAQDVQFIPYARVPLLIFRNSYNNISFDVSIDNHFGVVKSFILLLISRIDERFQDMVLLIKEWAKAQDINDPKSGTLNSYSLCLLVVFHFQTCEPPILPPLREIYGGNIADDISGWTSNPERLVETLCTANIERFKSQVLLRRNKSSLSQLLVSFFQKFSNMGRLASDYCICTYQGRWKRIESSMRLAEKPYTLLIRDPFEQSENAARAVGVSELRKISDAFVAADVKLSSSSVRADRYELLTMLTRPVVRLRLELGSQANVNTSRSQPNQVRTINTNRSQPSQVRTINTSISQPSQVRTIHLRRPDGNSRPGTSATSGTQRRYLF